MAASKTSGFELRTYSMQTFPIGHMIHDHVVILSNIRAVEKKENS